MNDKQAKAILKDVWRERTRLWERPNPDGWWIRARPGPRSPVMPYLKTPGAELFSTQPDGLWLCSSQPGVELTYIKQGAEGTGDAGDQYTGLDRFGRVYDQRWLVTSSGTAVDRFQYGFDRNSNRVFRDNLVASSGQDEYYSYDNLNQLTVLKRGDLNAGRTDISGTPVWQENFTFDPTGNWHGSSSGYVTRTSGVIDLDQNRSNNPVNEITGFTTTTGTGWATPAYNAVGNMTTMPQPASLANGYTAQYDAWNRLVELKNGTTTVATYRYDGATRRVTKWVGSNTTHFYYSDR